MRFPLDLGGLEILIAVGLLISGTIVFCVALALGARAVDRGWDAVAGAGIGRSSGSAVRVSRTGAVAAAAAALLVGLTWASIVLGRAPQLG